MSSKLKENSSNALNLKLLASCCEVNEVLERISPRWKVQILYSIANDFRHFSQLKKAYPSLSDQVLGKRLAELVADNLAAKEPVPDTVPPQTQYSVTRKGQELLAIILDLHRWGKKHNP